MVTLERFRELAVQLPQVGERDYFCSPSFRIRGKIFAQFSRGVDDLIFKISRDERDVLRTLAGDSCNPGRSSGTHGWPQARVAKIDDVWVDRLLRDAWRRATPKKMHGELDSAI